jgi:uncharacterized protein
VKVRKNWLSAAGAVITLVSDWTVSGARYRMVNDLYRAISENDFESFRTLLMNYPYLADARAEQGVSAILFAIYHGRPEFANELVRARARVGIHEAAALGDLEKIRELIETDSQLVNAFSEDGFQPLGLSAFFKNAKVAEYLLEHGADANTPSRNGQKVAPIHSAAAAGVSGIVFELIKKGANVNARQQGGYTALHAAIQNRDLETITILIRNGADCESGNDVGQTPRDLASKDDVEEVHNLLRACK